MNSQTVMDMGMQTVIVAMKLGAPALVSIMLMGLLVSIFQAATQINEQTLSFIPKILAMTVALIITGPWILQTIVVFTIEIFKKLPTVTK